MKTITITSENFEEAVLNSDKPVLVDFWATWCGPCRMQGPILEELAEERDDIVIGKLNVDEEQMLAFKYQVSSIPMLMLFKNGEVSAKALGLHSKDQLIEALGL